MASFFKQQAILSPNSRHSVRSSGTNKIGVKSMISAPFAGSAYSRIFGTKNVSSNILPSFMISDHPKQGITENDMQKFNILNSIYSNPQDSLSRTQNVFEQAAEPIYPEPIMRPSLSIGNRLRLSTEKIEEIKKIEKIQRSIFNPTLPPNENLLSIRKRQLKREDLVKLKEGVDLPECLIDCYMSIQKQSNTLRAKCGPNAKKVLIASASFSQMIFLKGREIGQPKANIFKYDFLVFPMNVSYWTVMIVDMKRMTVRLCDPVKEHRSIAAIMARLLRFIHRAVKADSNISYNFQFIPTSISNLSVTDSGVYICNEASNIANETQNVLTQENIDAHRKDMLVTLVKASDI